VRGTRQRASCVNRAHQDRHGDLADRQLRTAGTNDKLAVQQIVDGVNARNGINGRKLELEPAGGSYRLSGRIAQVPEGRQLFADMTVDDNLRLGAWRVRNREPARVLQLFPPLLQLRRRIAGTLSGGEQQMVAVGRALMAEPDLLAVDELSLGLAPMVVDDLAEHMLRLNRERGMAVLLVEQNARLALELCPRAYVLESGRIALSGPSAELATSPAVQAAYLGGATDE
jgi:branched-chain amino acid transport system ATP-binding protein